jgi:hypothetical protein
MGEISIENTALSVRALHVLHKMNIHTIDDLTSASIDEISKQRNAGAKTISEITTLINVIRNGDWKIDEETLSGEKSNIATFSSAQFELMSFHTIEELNLSTRAFNGLKKCGFSTVEEVVKLSVDDLADIKNLGAKSKQDIIDARETWLINNGIFPTEGKEECEDSEEDYYFKVMSELIRPVGIVYWSDLKRFAQNSDNYDRIIYGGFQSVDSENLIALFELKDLRPILEQFAVKILSSRFITEEELLETLKSLSFEFSSQIIVDRLLELGVCDIFYGYFLVNRSNVNEYLESVSEQIEERIYSIIYYKLDGETLQTIGELLDVTRERVRQIFSRQIAKFPLLIEDYFRIPFESFNIEKRDFIVLFPEVSKWGYEYLSQRYKHGKQVLSKESIEKYSGPYIDRIKEFYFEKEKKTEKDSMSRTKMVYKVLMSNSDTSVSMEEFEKLYNQYILVNEYNSKKLKLNIRTLTNHLRTARNIVFNKDNQFRYLNVDFKTLDEEINFSIYRDLVISAELIWKDYLDVMSDYDIRDGYELYCLIKTADEFARKNSISCRRIPTLIIGNGSEEIQALHLLKELSPIDYYDYYAAYEDRFGVRKESALGNPTLSHFLSNYLANGVYAIDVPAINENDVDAFVTALDASKIWFIDDLEKLFRQTCVNSLEDALNAASFTRIGYTLNAGYAYKSSYGSVTNFFDEEIFSDDIIDLSKFDPRLMNLSAFASALDKKKRTLEYIEVSPKILFSIKKVNNDYSLSFEEIQNIQKQLSYYTIDEYFNAQSIWNNISDLPLVKKLNSNTWMCTCIMRQQEGICSLRVAGNIILSRDSENLNIQSICKWMAQQFGKMTLYTLSNKVNELFGSSLTMWKIAEKVKSSGLWDDIITDSLDEYIDSLMDSSNSEDDFFQEEFF